MFALEVTFFPKENELDNLLELLKHEMMPFSKNREGFVGVVLIPDFEEYSIHEISLWKTKENAEAIYKTQTFELIYLKILNMVTQAPIAKQYEGVEIGGKFEVY